MHMLKQCTHEQLIEELGRRAQESSMTEIARQVGVSVVYISEILRGKRPMSDRVAEHLGYERLVIYRKRAA